MPSAQFKLDFESFKNEITQAVFYKKDKKTARLIDKILDEVLRIGDECLVGIYSPERNAKSRRILGILVVLPETTTYEELRDACLKETSRLHAALILKTDILDASDALLAIANCIEAIDEQARQSFVPEHKEPLPRTKPLSAEKQAEVDKLLAAHPHLKLNNLELLEKLCSLQVQFCDDFPIMRGNEIVFKVLKPTINIVQVNAICVEIQTKFDWQQQLLQDLFSIFELDKKDYLYKDRFIINRYLLAAKVCEYEQMILQQDGKCAAFTGVFSRDILTTDYRTFSFPDTTEMSKERNLVGFYTHNPRLIHFFAANIVETIDSHLAAHSDNDVDLVDSKTIALQHPSSSLVAVQRNLMLSHSKEGKCYELFDLDAPAHTDVLETKHTTPCISWKDKLVHLEKNSTVIELFEIQEAKTRREFKLVDQCVIPEFSDKNDEIVSWAVLPNDQFVVALQTNRMVFFAEKDNKLNIQNILSLTEVSAKKFIFVNIDEDLIAVVIPNKAYELNILFLTLQKGQWHCEKRFYCSNPVGFISDAFQYEDCLAIPSQRYISAKSKIHLHHSLRELLVLNLKELYRGETTIFATIGSFEDVSKPKSLHEDTLLMSVSDSTYSIWKLNPDLESLRQEALDLVRSNLQTKLTADTTNVVLGFFGKLRITQYAPSAFFSPYKNFRFEKPGATPSGEQDADQRRGASIRLAVSNQ